MNPDIVEILSRKTILRATVKNGELGMGNNFRKVRIVMMEIAEIVVVNLS